MSNRTNKLRTGPALLARPVGEAPLTPTVPELPIEHLLHRAAQHADALLARHAGASTAILTGRQYVVMRAIAQNSGASQILLTEVTGIDRSTLAEIMRRLQVRGLITRRRTRMDARTNTVRLTPQGERVVELARPLHEAADREVLELVPKSQRAGFLAALKALSRRLDAQ